MLSHSDQLSIILPDILGYCRISYWSCSFTPLFLSHMQQWYSTDVPSSDILWTWKLYERVKQWYSTNVPSSSDILWACQAVIPIAVVLQGQGMLKCALKVYNVWELIHRLAWKVASAVPVYTHIFSVLPALCECYVCVVSGSLLTRIYSWKAHWPMWPAPPRGVWWYVP